MLENDCCWYPEIYELHYVNTSMVKSNNTDNIRVTLLILITIFVLMADSGQNFDQTSVFL